MLAANLRSPEIVDRNIFFNEFIYFKNTTKTRKNHANGTLVNKVNDTINNLDLNS